MTSTGVEPTAIRRRFDRLALAVVVVLLAAASVTGVAVSNAGAGSSVGTGVVVVETELAYEDGAAAGTGIVLTSSGEILTNNHVIRGATTIRVVVPGTGRSYAAKVVGYDVVDDVALLRARGASNLTTVRLGNSATVKVGQAVSAVGNAGGTGSLVTAAGKVTALRQAITVSDDQGGSTRLTGLIQTSAALQSGDSGGPLMTRGRVVGMNTAASVGYGPREVASRGGYAIPINKAMGIVRLIRGGKGSARSTSAAPPSSASPSARVTPPTLPRAPWSSGSCAEARQHRRGSSRATSSSAWPGSP